MDPKYENKTAIPVMEAAAELGSTRLRILMLVKEGILQGSEADGEWMIAKESLNRFKSEGGDSPAKTICGKQCRGCGGH